MRKSFVSTLAIGSLAMFAGCQANLPDALTFQADFFYRDNVTPLRNAGFTSYNINFTLFNGANIIKTYDRSQLDSGVTIPGVYSDMMGMLRGQESDLALYHFEQRTRYVDSCIQRATACEWDSYYGDYYCYDYCVQYASYPVTDTRSVWDNFHDVASSQAWVEYRIGTTAMHTIGTRQSDTGATNVMSPERDGTYVSSSWRQHDRFVIPSLATSPAQSSGPNEANLQNSNLALDPAHLQAIQANQSKGFSLANANGLEDRTITDGNGRTGKLYSTLVGERYKAQKVAIADLTPAQKERVLLAARTVTGKTNEQLEAERAQLESR